MARHFKTVFFCMLTWSSLLMAETKQIPPAPKPAQILAAKKVFIGNAGGDEPFYDDQLFNGGPDRAYNEFYAAVKAAGRYDLQSAPGDADLLFEIWFTIASSRVPPPEKGVASGIFGSVPYDPQLRLEIRDPKSNALLWAFTEHVQWAILQGNRDKNFEQALSRIVSDLQSLTIPYDASSKP
ncbi:MAG TPA: hypothetical protein VH088_11355 [Terriglobales bacterium]|nr:hypothetical protein [Terriglobales bacterium]